MSIFISELYQRCSCYVPMKTVVATLIVLIATTANAYDCEAPGGYETVDGLIEAEVHKNNDGSLNIGANFPTSYKHREFSGAVLHFVDGSEWLSTSLSANRLDNTFHVLFGGTESYIEKVRLEVTYNQKEAQEFMCHFNSTIEFKHITSQGSKGASRRDAVTGAPA